MKAREAHKLVVGDVIVTAFSNSFRKARIEAIDWPHFVCRTTLANGTPTVKRRRYRSLYSVAEYTRCCGEPRMNGTTPSDEGGQESGEEKHHA